ncbi:MAG: hypothetical protein HN457_06495 [Opitutales bacterium]|jgi:hypothetical protein|nr:hypothetical protein [Opitutales bacterium]MBT5170240.1 hypothetical protein [Opitutales bacterium]MBT5815069.1 hypothetical protein [Opitutales bacterium]MBT6769618.1 hypothetical protein [Opitutales bacterium]
MKKTYSLIHPKIKVPRLVDSIKHDVRKYLKRERRKKLPEGVDYWDFDCKFGPTEDDAKVVHVAEISKSINSALDQELDSFYVEILAKPGHRNASR